MTKKELELKILELEKRISNLEPKKVKLGTDFITIDRKDWTSGTTTVNPHGHIYQYNVCSN